MKPDLIEFKGLGGLKLVADSYGTPGNPPVMFAHGGGQTRHAWGGTAKMLAERGWHAVCLDLRGHGDSAWCPDANYAIDAYAEDLRMVARTFAKRPVTVGASLGGISSLLAEGEHEGPIFSAVIFVDISPRVAEAGVANIRNFMSANMKEGFASLEEAAESIAQYLPHRPKPKDTSGLAKNLRLRENGRYYWHWDPKFFSGPNGPRDPRRPERLEDAARKITCPALLVRGQASDLVTMESAQAFLAVMPHMEFVDVTGAGHMVAGDKNDVFTDAVMQFLNKL
ncbi:MAG: alpha/beta hydrolase [Alphaproteobacteria bacterium]|nr:alpha/beta hydrolase [Alphaproteobacteria bacterium]